MDRRKFIRNTVAGSMPLVLTRHLDLLPPIVRDEIHSLHDSLATLDPADETFWEKVRDSFELEDGILDLNNAGINSHTIKVQKFLRQENAKFNRQPSRYNEILRQKREEIRQKLAELIQADKDEIAIGRNATEIQSAAIFGLPLKKGDEVIVGKYDYPYMVYAWKQRAKRDKIRIKWVDNAIDIRSETDLIERYTGLKSRKTRAIHLTHILNYNGLRIPVERILEAFPEKRTWKLVDGAQSIGQCELDIRSLNCTHFGGSLHKWLGAPVGTGLLWVNQKSIRDTYPLYAADDKIIHDIRKFEALGTYNTVNEAGILPALAFYELLGADRKQRRLLKLRDYWIDGLKSIPGFQLKSSNEDNLKSAIGLFEIKGMDNRELVNTLWKKHKIHVVQINWENLKGVRVSPNVYTLMEDLDKFIAAVRNTVKSQ